ncbi:LDLR chaperone boca-like [Oscarella lobularis]|uniref:LDLR chaperone boca-like n=1 Tax=Oscarella lobularis TaxID=121494 RepID=UPI0033134BE3
MTFVFVRFLVLISLLSVAVLSKEKPKTKKSLTDYTDEEIDQLFDQWEVSLQTNPGHSKPDIDFSLQENEDEKDPDDYAHLKPPKQPNVQFDPSKPISNVEDMLKQSKKGQTLMLFADVAGTPRDRARGEAVTARWQSSLFNANIHTQRYMLDDMRAIFVIQDGSVAWDVKDFLVTQEDCRSVELEQKTYWGPGASAEERREKEAKTKKEDEVKETAFKKMAEMQGKQEL